MKGTATKKKHQNNCRVSKLRKSYIILIKKDFCKNEVNLQFSLFKRVTYILDKFYEAFQTRWFSESKCLHRHYLVDHSLGITY